MVLLFAAALALSRAETPIDRLAGDWTSLETVTKADGSKGTLRLKGKNRWVYPGDLLEISENYTVDGETEPGQNHIMVKVAADGKLNMYWFVPKRPTPLSFDGVSDAKGMVFTQKDGPLRISYVWDGNDAYDAKLEVKVKDKEEWTVRTVARYTRQN